MADEQQDAYAFIFKELAADIAEAAKMKLEEAKAMVREYGPMLARLMAEAQQADADGNDALAKKKRQSIKHIKNDAVLSLARFGVQATNKIERAVMTVIDKALSKIG